MLAKVILREEGRVVVAFEAETPAEGMILGLVVTEQVAEVSASLNSYPRGDSLSRPAKLPEASVHLGSFSLRTVEMVQGK